MNNKVYCNDPALLWMQPLDDIMDMICKYLNGKDLSKVAKVCKSWRGAALRESGRRYRLLQLPLCHKIYNLASTLHVIPSVSLFFFDQKLKRLQGERYDLRNPYFNSWTYYDNTEELLRDYQPQLPNDTIVMEVDTLYKPELTGKCDLLGMFFPSAEHRVSVRVSWLHNRSANLVAEDLGMNNSDSKSTIILMFCTYSHMDFMIIAELARRAQRKGEEITLASIFGNSISAANYHTEMNKYSTFTTTLALRISGSSIESCSTFIPFFAREEEITRKLEELKEKIKYKRFNTGLLYAPKCIHCSFLKKGGCGSQHVTMFHLERFFPKISFTGFFSTIFVEKTRSDLITVDRIDENIIFSEEFLRDLPYYASIIIISYD